MENSQHFTVLISRLETGDQLAAEELIRHFEPEIRRFVRFRLSSPALRRVFDSLDVVQSVLAKFFVQISAGELKLENTKQLKVLLLTMARNKLYDRVRQQRAARRDGRRNLLAGDEAIALVADRGDSPSEQLVAREVLEAVQAVLTEDERRLIEERLSGRAWEDLAVEWQVSPEALRKRMVRALDNAAATLGLRGE